MNNKRKLITIGIGSIARTGKDLLATLLRDKFEQDGFTTQRYALANELKKDCEAFLKEKLGMDVWTNDTNEKAKFREFLVWYGKMKREASQGTYWTNLLQERIEGDFIRVECPNTFVAIVSDVRYCDPTFPEDEVSWLKKKMGGILINVNRTLPDGTSIEPANRDEELNSLRVSAVSNYDLTWETKEDTNVLIEQYVNPLYAYILSKI